ncbi:MAG: YdhK family protein [Bacillota bacterium]|uniref:YdhK family protein n=1 Tax=Virgibacillus TaxID=84406 RepID=UPI001964E2AA|nr:YdhK family protein [Virgibacillus sp. AGTR]MCC2249557.1 YdhK family protein [Virgibacillus sp. AGTR]QRZ19362.1 YdhK family protein [Virgibacillus sp. AGTR]
MNKRKWGLAIGIFIVAMTLSACGSTQENNDSPTENADPETESGLSDHDQMEHSSSEYVPKGLQTAKNPTYEVGSKAIIETDHMEGMKGAEATISGAYDTTVYTITYTPTNGGKKVENHKWVIHEELMNPGAKRLESGSEVKVEASHMKGMDGATATIDSAKDTTVYMVDYISNTSGEEVKNHKWVTEDELSPAN